MSVENQKSLEVNMILNASRGILSVLFPLITFLYISRILGVENIGRYNYSSSIISYFVLLAGLGITSYAIREGAAVREDPSALNKFANEVFTINILSMAVSYLLLVILLCTVPELRGYFSLLVILSCQIFLKTIGIEWLYSIYEDYLYITIRSIAFQVISLVLLLLFVRTKNDVDIYAAITVVACAGSNILNYFHARKRIHIRLTRQVDWKRHLSPIFVLFAMSLTVSVYVNSDVTVLGILCGDRTVGIYSVSTKIYALVKQTLGTVLVVSIPRLSSFYGTGRLQEFRQTAQNVYKIMITAMMPALTGIIALSKPIVLMVSGDEYIDASASLAILGVALLLCMAAWFWGQCILVPMKQEKEVFRITIVSAVLNIVLNLLLIPFWQEKATAFTTVLAEGCSYLWSMIQGKKRSGVAGVGSTYLKSAVGCIGILTVCAGMKYLFESNTAYVLASVTLSIAVYSAIEILIKNEAVYSMVHEIRRLKK